MRHIIGALVLLCMGGTAGAQEMRFIVRDQVVTPGIQAFATTIPPVGNGIGLTGGGGGFEPAVLRTRLQATQDAADTVFADPAGISGRGLWREGLLDGARVEVLRIAEGRIVTVRRDRVAPGGHLASGWTSALPQGQVLNAPGWEETRPAAAVRHYTVRAVDDQGRLSPPADPVLALPPGQAGDARPMHAMTAGTGTAGLAAPAGLRVVTERPLRLDWDPVAGAAGYLVQVSDRAPADQRGYALHLAGKGPAIRTGDMVLLRQKIDAPPPGTAITDPLWQGSFGRGLLGQDPPPARILRHAPDTPVAEPGETYLQADLSPGRDLRLGRRNHAGADQLVAEVLNPAQTYRIEVWLRADGPVTARFETEDPAIGLPAAAAIGPEWRRYSADFRPAAVLPDGPSRWMGVVLSGTGRVDVDNLRMYRTDAPFMDLLPEDRAALATSGMSALRTHGFIKTGTKTYDLAQLLAPAGVGPQANGSTLPQVLAVTAALGMEPWLQIEPHLTRAEWLGLAEYLAAPAGPDRPWAALRAARGQDAPWVDVFPRIRLEIGNETWNPMFAPWTFDPMPEGGWRSWRQYTAGEVYGLYQERVLAILRSSPWWPRLAPRLEPVIGGWNGLSYGVDALIRSPNTHVLTHAAYLGGWDVGDGPAPDTPAGFAKLMQAGPGTISRSAARYREEVRRRLPGRQVTRGTYEIGPGYALNGLNGARVTPEQMRAQERVMKSAAAGATTLDSLLARARQGEQIQSYFLFMRGRTWRSHAQWQNGGQAYPSWDWLALFNHVGTGDMLAVEGPEGAQIGVYATRRDDRLTITVVSRAVPGLGGAALPVRIDLPIRDAARLVHYRQSGPWNAENSLAEETRIIAEDRAIADPARLEIAAMPPASAGIYVYEGVAFAP